MYRMKNFLRRYKAVISLVLTLALYCAISMVLHIPCPIVWLTGVSCPGCGITRACLSLCRLDFAKALYYNPSIFFVLPAAVLIVVFSLKKMVKARKTVVILAAAGMVLVYICRMAVLHSPVLELDPRNGVIPRLWRWMRSIL